MTQVTDELPGKSNQNIDEAKLKADLIAKHKQTVVQKTDFPTEVINLPSKGLLYSEGHPLSAGTIELKYMTAKEEDILASQNLIKQGVVIDKLLQSMIVTPVDYNDLVMGDKNAILLAARVLGYGKIYNFDWECPSCSEKTKQSADLTGFDDKLFDESLITPHHNEFTYVLPNSNRTVKFKLMDNKTDTAVTKEIKAKSKTGNSAEITTRMAHLITEIDGQRETAAIRNFVNNELFAIDSKSLRDYVKEITPDVDTNITIECKYCGHEESRELPIDVNFFWPGS